MTTVTNLLAQNVNILDTIPATGYSGQPMTQLSAGEGGPAVVKIVEDVTALTASYVSASANYARILRFPTNAKVKRLDIYTDAAPDSSTSQALAIEFGVAFSDAPNQAPPLLDGTPPYLTALIPTTANTGATTTFASFSSPNNIFGTLTLAGNNAAIAVTDITYQGVGATYPAISILQTPLLELFGFTTGQGYNIEQMGYFDIYAYVSHAANTAHAANLITRLEFTDV